MRFYRGFTLIELLVVVLIIGVLLGLLLPAVQSAREASRRAECTSNLKQIGIAFQSYIASLGGMPFGVGGSGPPARVPRWSAQSQALAFMDQTALFNAINFSGLPWVHTEPVYGAINQTALSVQLSVFLCPSDSDDIERIDGLAHNSYRACAGTYPFNLKADSANGTGWNSGAFWFQSAVGPAQFTDGMSTTALFSERCLGVPDAPDPSADYYFANDIASCAATSTQSPRYENAWEWSGQRWADGNVFFTRYHHIFTPNRTSCLFGSLDYNGQILVTATSRHPGGVNVQMADGSVRFVKDTISPQVWKAMATIAGMEAVDASEY